MADQFYWKAQQSIDDKNVHVMRGYSVAADKTGYFVSSLAGGTLLDCGIDASYKPHNILITHGHMDHSSGLSKVLVGMNDVHPTIYCPKSIEGMVKNSIDAMFSLSKNTPTPRIHNKYKLIGVNVGQRIPFSFDKHKRVTMLLEIIYCHHTVPCVGYGFIEIRTKLRDDEEFNQLIKEEQKMQPTKKVQEIYSILKERGIILTREIEVPLFCYMGDTDDRALYEKGSNKFSSILEKYPSIIIECTFIDSDKEHKKHANDDCHMHWDNLKPYIVSHPDTRFILIHFSARYTYDYINDFFIKENLKNIFPMISNILKNTPDILKKYQDNEDNENNENNEDNEDNEDMLKLDDVGINNVNNVNNVNTVLRKSSEDLSDATAELKKMNIALMNNHIFVQIVILILISTLTYVIMTECDIGKNK